MIVGDIDRGGVFAAFLGTVALLSPDDQALVAGFVVNKFRGDRGLLQPGIDQMKSSPAAACTASCRGSPDLWLDSEDSLDLAGRRRTGGDAAVKVVVVRLPRISNFTDADALGLEPGIDVVFTSDARALRDADLVVLPGTRATLADLAWLRSRGLDGPSRDTRRPGGRCSASAAASRCWAGRSSTRTASRALPEPKPRGWGCST